MILTDTPGTTFDKVSIDIVELLPTTKSEIVYTHNTKFATKYSVAMLLKQTTLSEIAEAFIEKAINSYTAPKA